MYPMWWLCRFWARIEGWMGWEDVSVAGPDYNAIAYYSKFNQKRADELAEEMFPEVK